MSSQYPLLYFAYGRNMHVSIMAERCPAAEKAGLAVLPAHRILINTRGVSTVVPDPAQQVHGVLWHLTPACEETLDRIEGVARGHYTKDAARAAGENGEVTAMIYLASGIEPGPPKPGYLEALQEAAAHHGFPDAYCRHLAGLRTPG